MNLVKKQRLTSLLGLSLDGSRLEGIVVRRTNGSLTLQKSFVAVLTLDPLTNPAELVGREIRNHLEKAQIREKRCVVNVPLKWALTAQTKLPELPEEDLASLLLLEAERSFPYGPEALVIAESRYRTPAGEQYATQVAVPKDHISRLEGALQAAGLKPLMFSLGITALQGPENDAPQGVLALAVGENGVGLQVTSGGGVAALRALEGTLETENGQKRVYADVTARETRITLAQLPNSVREGVRLVKVFGPSGMAQQLVEDIRHRLGTMGMQVQLVKSYSRDDFGVNVPLDAEVSPALSAAARYLTDTGPVLTFVVEKVSPWKQYASKYTSRKLGWTSAAAAAALFIAALFFGYQQWQLSSLGAEWANLSPKVTELDNLQHQIRKYRPWYNDSIATLTILRRLTEAFPEEGDVTAKTIEIRELSTVTCSGTARDNQSLLKTLDKLRAVKEISDVTVDSLRGKAPLQFTFNFHWGQQGQP